MAADLPAALAAARSLVKRADLRPGVRLQPHQERVASGSGSRLLYHGLGTGKTLAALAAAEAAGGPATVVAPAALRPQHRAEVEKFTDGELPYEVLSYDAAARGTQPAHAPATLIIDESQRLRNPDTKTTRAVTELSRRAGQTLLLSGSPIVNRPGDLATAYSILTGQTTSPEEFERRFVRHEPVRPGPWGWMLGAKPGEVDRIQHADRLERELAGRVDYEPPRGPAGVKVEPVRHAVPLSPEQLRLQRGMFRDLSWGERWKLENDFPLSRRELKNLSSFLAGPRQLALSTRRYGHDPDPAAALAASPKLTAALANLRKTFADPRAKALVFSNFPDAGLEPYAAGLRQAGIPHAVFHGGLDDRARRQAVEDYNSGKIRALLLGPAGAEGISTKGTSLIQLLDPHWNEARSGQAQGRGLRFDSHEDLPEELRNVKVERYIATGSERSPSADEILERLAARKEELNEQFRAVLRHAGRVVAGHQAKAAARRPAKFQGEHLDLPLGEPLTFVRQHHHALKAGPHEDWRLGNRALGLLSWAVPRGAPAPGTNHRAIRTNVHGHKYKDFEGEIPAGRYGAGTVRKILEGAATVTRAEPRRIDFTTGAAEAPERYSLFADGGGDRWLLRRHHEPKPEA